MGLTRRALIKQLGLATVAHGFIGCGSSPSRSSQPAEVTESLRARLAELVSELEGQFPVATALARRRVRLNAGRDRFGVVENQTTETVLVLHVFDGARWHARSSDELSAKAADELARELRASRKPTSVQTTKLDSRRLPRNLTPRASAAGQKARDAVESLYQRVSKAGSSRTVYRGASAIVDRDDVLFIGGTHNARQSIERSLAAAAFVSRGSGDLVSEEAMVGSSGETPPQLTDTALQQLSDRSLTLVGGDIAETDDIDVVLSHDVAAAIAIAIADELFNANAWVSGLSPLAVMLGDQVADRRFTLVDDPLLTDGYASYDLDDEGATATRIELVANGLLGSPFCDRHSAAALGRQRTGHARIDYRGQPRPVTSNVSVGAGELSESDLVNDVKSGYLVESPTLASIDPARRRVVIHARRAREILRGSLSGRVLGPLTLDSDILGLMLAVRGVSRETQARALVGEVSRSIETPLILTRARISR